MAKTQAVGTGFDWRDLDNLAAYSAWKSAKIRKLEAALTLPPVEIDSLLAVDPDAISDLRARAAETNMALYSVRDMVEDVDADCAALAGFAATFGLHQSEAHRSAGTSGVVALRSSDAPSKAEYIPYSTRPMNWHTDGYYNPGNHPVKSFILHCHSPGATGGENQFADPELVYLRMRDDDPALIRALMAPDVMTIPENVEPDGSIRPASVGPVFFADDKTGRLQMRYTARTRSITWKDNAATKAATEWLTHWFQTGDALVLNKRLAAGEGILCNNALHNRTGFQDEPEAGQTRVMLRARFHDRLAED